MSPSPTLLRCPSPGPYAAPMGVEPMGTFFVEAPPSSARCRWCPPSDAAEVLITLEGRTLVDPVQRKLIPALQYGAANGH